MRNQVQSSSASEASSGSAPADGIDAEAADTAAALVTLARECGARRVRFHWSYDPQGGRVEQAVMRELHAAGVEACPRGEHGYEVPMPAVMVSAQKPEAS